MTTHDTPMCIEHKRELNRKLNILMIGWFITLVLAFISGFAFCKVVGGA